MANSNLNYTYIDEQDYLDGEKLADIRHEYREGNMYAMAGTSKRHNRITLNFVIALSSKADKPPCDVYSSDIKVKIASRNSYYYPDVVVGCDESDNADEYYLEKPCLIIEVLSPSTERKDETEKLLAYQEIKSLQTYLMVDQQHCHIRFIYRQKNGRWWVKTYTELDAVISLPCPKMEIKVIDIYNNISFDSGC